MKYSNEGPSNPIQWHIQTCFYKTLISFKKSNPLAEKLRKRRKQQKLLKRLTYLRGLSVLKLIDETKTTRKK